MQNYDSLPVVRVLLNCIRNANLTTLLVGIAVVIIGNLKSVRIVRVYFSRYFYTGPIRASLQEILERHMICKTICIY